MPFVDVDGLPEQNPIPGYHARFVHSEHMTVAFWTVAADAPLPEHRHPHEQIASVVAGKYELVVGGETRVLTPGMVAVIPSNVPHSGRALTDCELMDVFHPVREEYR
ncbi:MAG TPA: cupin domain-containing protein [Gemmatimonadales bacterium]|jgi:quercetin dioxygenase-like cupin family protein